MSAARQFALTACSLVPLILVAALSESEGRTSRPPTEEPAVSVAEASNDAAVVLRSVERRQLEQRRRQVDREDVGVEAGPRPQARGHRLLADAEPIARRFFHAFSLYELGRLDRAAARQIRRTATPVLARTLRSPPRVLGTRIRGRLVRIQVGGVGAVHGKATKLELIGQVRRGRSTRTISIEMVRTARGWRVAGLGE